MSDDDYTNIKTSLKGFETKLEENLKFISTQFDGMNKRFAGKWTEPIIMLILGTLLGMVAFPFFAAGAQLITVILQTNIS